MTKRKTTQKLPLQAPTESVETIKEESNSKVAGKPKQVNSTAKKATTKAKGRSKKVVAEPTVEVNLPAPVSKVIDVDSRTITYASAGNAVPSKYEQFKAWLVYKLCVVTSYFRGF